MSNENTVLDTPVETTSSDTAFIEKYMEETLRVPYPSSPLYTNSATYQAAFINGIKILKPAEKKALNLNSDSEYILLDFSFDETPLWGEREGRRKRCRNVIREIYNRMIEDIFIHYDISTMKKWLCFSSGTEHDNFFYRQCRKVFNLLRKRIGITIPRNEPNAKLTK